MRILFITDLHGSTLLFKKALRVVNDFEIDAMILGGDLSGKRLLAIAPNLDGGYVTSEVYKKKDDTGKAVEMTIPKTVGKAELDNYLKRLEAKGIYWHIAERGEIEELNENVRKLQVLSLKKIYDRLVEWAKLASERLPEGVKCFWTGGNDDDQEMLEQLSMEDLGRFLYVEDQVVDLFGYQVLSMGFSNKTPFNTDRELEEEEISNRLMRLADNAKSTEKMILNVHVPPYNCGTIDLVTNLKDPSRSVHVGSKGVRTFIENIQPLADFAGHVHEGTGTAKIGRTQVFNPGSDYYAGILQGYVVDILDSRIGDFAHFTR
ncbi:MAG: metallophosphoesterase [Acidobacteriia bacterium]|nr:metallophosphoesterase [Terriglobia bacterium]